MTTFRHVIDVTGSRVGSARVLHAAGGVLAGRLHRVIVSLQSHP